MTKDPLAYRGWRGAVPRRRVKTVPLEAYFSGMCPHCGARGPFVRRRDQAYKVHDLGEYRTETLYFVDKPLLKCEACSRRFTPQHPNVPPRHHITWHVLDEVFFKLHQGLSEAQIAAHLQQFGIPCSQRQVNRWFHRFHEEFLDRIQADLHQERGEYWRVDQILAGKAIAWPYASPRPGTALAMDGTVVKMWQRGWRRARSRCVLCVFDVGSKRLLAYTIGRRENRALAEAALKQVKAQGISPEIITIDMCPALIGAIRNIYPKAKIHFDRFHVMQNANRHLSKLLRHKFRKPYERCLTSLEAVMMADTRAAVIQGLRTLSRSIVGCGAMIFGEGLVKYVQEWLALTYHLLTGANAQLGDQWRLCTAGFRRTFPRIFHATLLPSSPILPQAIQVQFQAIATLLRMRKRYFMRAHRLLFKLPQNCAPLDGARIQTLLRIFPWCAPYRDLILLVNLRYECPVIRQWAADDWLHLLRCRFPFAYSLLTFMHGYAAYVWCDRLDARAHTNHEYRILEIKHAFTAAGCKTSLPRRWLHLRLQHLRESNPMLSVYTARGAIPSAG